MITNAQAADLFRAVSVAHRRTAPKPANQAEAVALAVTWAKIFNHHDLAYDDLEEAMLIRAGHNAEAPEPAELVAATRKLRMDRADKDPAARDDYEARLDAKIAALESRPLRVELEARGDDEGDSVGVSA